MKKFATLLLALVCMLVLTGCFCEHEWAEAGCVAPKTCTKCGETEGEPLGHVWLAATCTDPKTCESCGTTEGEAKGHAWVEATCTEARHCTQCGETEGEAPGHDWLDATTEAPQTCAVCGLTEGEKIVTDPRFKTSEVSDLLGTWACALELNGEALGIADFKGDLSFHYYLTFGNAGDFSLAMELGDEESFMEAMIQISVENAYAEMAAQGYSREAADNLFQSTYGMGLEEYLKASMANVSMNELLSSIFAAVDVGGVYYVEDGTLYMGMTWEGEMEPDTYKVAGYTLTIDSFSQDMGFEAVFYRVQEE